MCLEVLRLRDMGDYGNLGRPERPITTVTSRRLHGWLFTAFSSFAFETTQLMDGSGWLVAAGNVVLQNAPGIAAVLGGIALGRLFASGIESLA